jgi:hypothetical protein
MSITLALALTTTLAVAVQPQAVAAIDPLTPILDCSTNPGPSCIESIFAIKADGQRVKARLTGRTSPEERKYATESVLVANWQEYEFTGIAFDGNAGGAFIPRVFYFPQGNKDCFYDPCVLGNEYVEFAIGTTWLNGSSDLKILDLPYRKTNLSCGLKSSPSFCYTPRNFSQDISFEFNFRLPANFNSVTSNGRGVQSFDHSETEQRFIDGVPYIQHSVTVKPIKYSSYGFAGADIDEYADFELDNFQFWFWGQNDRRVDSLGSCKTTPRMSVVANTFWINFPTWNRADRSVEVNVAGPHFKSDGSLNLGYVQAKISKEMAQCLWGVDITKSTSAKISVIYDIAGQSQTQVATGKLLGSEYLLTISGMHFSSPTIKMKLEQAQPSPAYQTKKITCFKGKRSVVKMGESPVCPKGYTVKK